MKSIKPLLKTYYSEVLVSGPSIKGKERAIDDDEPTSPGPLIDAESTPDFTVRGGLNHGWHGGLGLVYKFPGDPRK